MRLGLQLADFTFTGGPRALAAGLRRIATTAEDVGFARLSVVDHVWRASDGPPEGDMLEAYTSLGFLAACTFRVELLAWVSAVTYREPGLLVKCASTLDVLSAGRAMLGVGAGWYADEAHGLGLRFPPTAERFERLEEALQICLQMWSPDDGRYLGRHYTLERTLNVPQPLQRPHPPILVAGDGEQKTLRLVAQYAQACNLVDTPRLAHKLDVLRRHCDAVGRDYDDIEKTVLIPKADVGARGERVGELLGTLRRLAGMGISYVHCKVPRTSDITPLELFGDLVIPEAATL